MQACTGSTGAANTRLATLSLRRRLVEIEEDQPEAFGKRKRPVGLLVESVSLGKRQEAGRAETQITYRFGPPTDSDREAVDDTSMPHIKNGREPEKPERAREVLRRVGGAGTVVLPARVLSEFGGACLSKLKPRPHAEAIRREVERLMLAFPLLALTGPVVLEAMRGLREHLLSHYDAQRIGRSSASGRWA